MHNSDPMGYTMEQLVKALAAEAMTEISYDDAEVVEEESPQQGMWENIAHAVMNEIDSTYQGGDLKPYGYHADECIMLLKPLVQSYAVYPAAHKLLTALEKVASAKADPRAYSTIVVRAMDSDAAKTWEKDLRTYR